MSMSYSITSPLAEEDLLADGSCFDSNFAGDQVFVHELASNVVSTHYNHVENIDFHSYAIIYIYISFLWHIHVGKVIFWLFDILPSCLLRRS